MSALFQFLWEDVILGLARFFGDYILSIDMWGIPLLYWIVGLIVLSGLATIILSVRPRFNLGAMDAAKRLDDRKAKTGSYRKKEI